MNACEHGYPLCSCEDSEREPLVQEIICEFPPIYPKIAETFNLHGRRDVVFSFGALLYNPHGLFIPNEILKHEAVHGERQGEGVEDVLNWWQRYIEDSLFRFVEEAHAHRAEYRWLAVHAGRRDRRRAVKQVAAKLASPLYGNLVTPAQARKVLEAVTYAG